MSDKYNGWNSYETWAVNLHLSNDEGTYNYVNELVEAAIEQANEDQGYYDTRYRAYVHNLARLIEEFTEDLIMEPVEGKIHMLAQDLLRSAFQETDFYEIAENWDDDAKDRLDPDDEEEEDD